MQDRLEQLLAPVSAERPAGEDLGYSPLFDQIREARRADDPALALGDWAVSVKSAEWPKAKKLAEDALISKSKDLQLAVWYGEALAKTEGFTGVTFGLRVAAGLLDRYWESAYPELDPDDLDERVGKLEWLNTQLGQAIRQIPLTAQQHGGYDWYRWQESRDVENLGRKDPESREKAMAEGKLSGEQFDKSALHSGLAFYLKLSADVAEARDAYAEFDAKNDERFGHAAANVSEIRAALNAYSEVVNGLLEQCGGRPGEASVTSAEKTAAPEADAHAPAAATSAAAPAVSGGPVRNRADAVRQLREVAHYFRTSEPHSPVALLAERAARWAEMPLEEWLQAVIKDDSTLGQLKELLDIRRE
ncbi:type VI secretion system protein TssA [Andreprevotia chitinilytica]|uniref:type VI secretion system protein TssA n=1 Tax=Andreprevotia chitinilytica TaxID=396808 RepID=UPI000552C497|nr:type VI secretion system protein TssA [Andreprevotia chitinilytica]